MRVRGANCARSWSAPPIRNRDRRPRRFANGEARKAPSTIAGLALAPGGALCFITSRVQRESRPLRLSQAAKSTPGAVLAILLFVCALLSASHTLHRSVHMPGASDVHFCLICCLAKGQVHAAEVGLGCGVLVLCLLAGVALRLPGFLSKFDRRLARSRAPPRS